MRAGSSCAPKQGFLSGCQAAGPAPVGGHRQDVHGFWGRGRGNNREAVLQESTHVGQAVRVQPLERFAEKVLH